jgi:hypothetical protein
LIFGKFSVLSSLYILVINSLYILRKLLPCF